MEFLQSMNAFCLVFVLAAVASAGQYPPDYEAPKHKPNVDGYEVGIAENLLNVMDFLQKADNASSEVGQCKSSIEAAMNSTPWVQALVLNNSYYAAIKRLDTIRDMLSNCSELYLPDNIYASEAMMDFAEQASKYVDKTTVLIGDLKHLWENNPELFSASLDTDKASAIKVHRKCIVDGTKCQYLRCGAGKRLPNCAIGFATGVTGGAYGISYMVTNNRDNPNNPRPGTLRYGVNLATFQRHGVWITFSHDMVIRLREMLWLKSHTTIDGRGANVMINGKSIVLARVHNVILHNFQINNVRESDTVHIFSGSSNVWVDHLTSFNAKLGLISVVQGSTDITISNCRLSNRNFNMLLGASDNDAIDQNLRVTIYRNWFKDSRQRMPHCRWGYCHVVNNFYSNWEYYAIGGRVHAKVYSERNVFYPGKKSEVTPWFNSHGSSLDTTAAIQSTQDLFLNGATFHQFVDYGKLDRPRYKHHDHYPPLLSTKNLSNLVKLCSGALHVEILIHANIWIKSSIILLFIVFFKLFFS